MELISLPPLLTTIITITIILTIKLTIKALAKPKLKLPPSPPSLPILGHLHLLRPPLHRSIAALAATQGHLILLRLGNRLALAVSSAAVANQCLSTHDLAFADRPHLPSRKHISYNYSTFSTIKYNNLCRHLRRVVVVELLAAHRVLSSGFVRADEAKCAVKELHQRYCSAGSAGDGFFLLVQLRPRLFQLVMNNLMRMVAGKRYYGDGEVEEEAVVFRRFVEGWFALGGASNVGDFVPVLRWFDYKGNGRKLRELHETRDRWFDSILDEHRKKGNEESNSTMVGALLELQRSDPENYTDDIIKSVCLGLLSAGTDTSTHTLEWAMTLLLNNEDTLRKLTAEIDSVVGTERMVSESDLPNIPYLRCVIMEAMRLCPMVPLMVPHESSVDCVVEGFHVPKGTMLLINNYAIQRDLEIWGDDALEFKPERFEEGEGKWMIPFGMGRRKCPGEGLAMRSMGLVLGTLVHCFEWRRVGDEPVDMGERPGLTMPKTVPLQALYRPRLAMLKVLQEL